MHFVTIFLGEPESCIKYFFIIKCAKYFEKQVALKGFRGLNTVFQDGTPSFPVKDAFKLLIDKLAQNCDNSKG